MKEEIYRKILVAASNAEDGETPTRIVVTAESNGYAVWRTGFNGQELLGFFFLRDPAIEQGVSATLDSPAMHKTYQLEGRTWCQDRSGPEKRCPGGPKCTHRVAITHGYCADCGGILWIGTDKKGQTTKLTLKGD